jgi:hypothetical protein
VEPKPRNLHRDRIQCAGRPHMGRYLLLWLLGVPLPILVLIYALGGLH